MSTLVLYYFQGDPGDSMDMPNAFILPLKHHPASAITYEVFCKYFPLHNDGSYHFRFQAEDPNHEYVWVDIQQPNQSIPLFRSNIIMVKILRMNEVFALKRRTLLRKKIVAPSKQQQVVFDGTDEAVSIKSFGSINPLVESSSTTTAKAVRATNAAPSSSSSSMKAMTTTSAKDNTTVLSKMSNVNDGNFLDFDEPTATPSTAPDKKHRSQQVIFPEEYASGPPIDIDIIDTVPIAPAELNREELKANLDNKINEQVRRALEDKLEQDRKLEQAEVDFDLAKQTHEQKLMSWSTNNKEKRNIRTLLSTMHTVLWADSRWKSIGLGDLLEPKQVKLQYRKAMLVVHPDHCVTLSNENKFLSKRIFEAVNEAYNEFLKKESV